MKDVIIVFGMLLVVLAIISTLGGSIRYAESFEDSKPKPPKAEKEPAPKKEHYEEEEPKKEEADKKETVEGFDGGAYAGIP
jgi:hypothetical protein